MRCFYVVIILLVDKNHDNMKVQNLYFFVIWSPNKRETQAQCRLNAGPPPTTPARHQINTRPMRCVYWAIAPIFITTKQDIRPPNVGTTPIKRRRLWTNTVPTLGERFMPAGAILSHIQCIVLSGSSLWGPSGSQSKHGTITQFCFNLGPTSNTIDRHWTSNGLRHWPNIEPVLGG